jgi:hypothetical protein
LVIQKLKFGTKLNKFAVKTISKPTHILSQLKSLSDILQTNGHQREANAVNDVLVICEQPTDLGGLGLNDKSKILTPEQGSEIVFLASAWLESLNSTDRTKFRPAPISTRPEGRRGMTLSEKIFALHDVNQTGSVSPGDLIRVDVDWVIASEASWKVGFSYYV